MGAFLLPERTVVNTQEWITHIETIKRIPDPSKAYESHQRFIGIARMEALKAELKTDLKTFQKWADLLAEHFNIHPIL
jgi:hypothetical protein